MPDKKKYLSVSEVAKLLDIGERTVYRYIESGALKAVKIGGWRIYEEDLKDFVKRGIDTKKKK